MDETDVLYKNRDIRKKILSKKIIKQTYFFPITGVKILI